MRRAIFLSYRRADTSDVVGRVNDALVGAFGESQIYRDVDSIPMGADFAAHIGATLKRCRVVLAFVGPDWADVRDEQGRRRLDDPNDLVRVELETALETPKLLVVPILVNGARMPNREELPVSLRDLTARNAGTMRRDPDFRADMGRLVDALRAHLRTGRLDLRSLGGTVGAAANASVLAAVLSLALVSGIAGTAAVPELREPVLGAISDVFAQPEAPPPTANQVANVATSLEHAEVPAEATIGAGEDGAHSADTAPPVSDRSTESEVATMPAQTTEQARQARWDAFVAPLQEAVRGVRASGIEGRWHFPRFDCGALHEDVSIIGDGLRLQVVSNGEVVTETAGYILSFDGARIQTGLVFGGDDPGTHVVAEYWISGDTMQHAAPGSVPGEQMVRC